MPTSRDLSPLIKLLARLYSTAQEAARVATVAKVPPEFIDLQGSAIQIWTSILAQAETRKRIGDLIEVVKEEYPECSSELLRYELHGRQGSAYWNVPNRNEFFTGREDLLDALDRLLQDNQAAALTQTINGLGGIGKTQIAVEFCHRNRDSYPLGVFWADASSAETLSDSYKNFAVDLGWAILETPMEDAVKVWLSRIAPLSGWLLILDNADDPEDVDHLIPNSASGHIVITTRHHNPGWGGTPLPVDVMPSEKAEHFLLNRSHRKAEEGMAAERLAKALGYLPLALEQAAAYLAQNRMIRIVEYLERFEEQQIAFTEKAKSKRPLKGGYEETVATTWEISFEKLPESAREALLALVFLNPENIPLDLFHEGRHLGAAMAELDLSDRFVIQDEIIEPLSAYSFVEVHDEGSLLSVHRLVQAVMLDRLSSEGQLEQSFKRLVTALDELLTEDPRLPSNWPIYDRWILHIQRAMTFWSLSEKPFESWLWNRYAHFAWSAGRSKDSQLLLHQQLYGFRRTLGEEHPSTLTAMANLASSLRTLGNAKAARELEEQTLEVSRRTLGEEHPSTLTAMVNLASSLRTLGDAKAARELLEQALEVRRRTLGEEHPSTLTAMANLAESLRALGDATAARELLEQTLEVRRRTLGEEHPSTLTAMANLASSLWALGDAKAARELLEQTLEVSRRTLGEEHPDTLTAMANLAESLRALGNAKAARELLEQALEVRRRTLGEEHPSTLTAMANLAESLRALGDATAARELLEQTLEVRRRTLGEEHPSTLTAMANLASSLWALGDAKTARELLEQALEVSRRTLGEEHPDTLTAMANLAEFLRALGNATAARELLEQALEVRRRTLGEEHPDTLTAMANLASSLWALGDANAARELEEQTLKVRRRTLGEEHPSTLNAMANLASSLWALGDAKVARELLEQTLEVSRRTLGEEHPDTLTAMTNLAASLRTLGNAKAARELLEQALEVSRRTLGEEHPDTLTAMTNLASTFRTLGDAKAAHELLEQTLEVRRRTLGEEHPDTLNAMANLASSLWALGDANAARELEEQTLEARRRTLGEEHPDTLASMHNLLFTLRETEGMETDPALIQELLQGVRKLPKNVDIRRVAESTWGRTKQEESIQ